MDGAGRNRSNAAAAFWPSQSAQITKLRMTDSRAYSGHFASGSDGTRTRDLRRDRPAL
jgi:hypothetical protein